MANEKRLIDANALKAHVNSLSTHWLCEWDTLGVLNAIDNQRTVDAVEVVRCEHCKHRKERTCYHPFAGMWVGCELKDSDFCSRGERKGDGDA